MATGRRLMPEVPTIRLADLTGNAVLASGGQGAIIRVPEPVRQAHGLGATPWPLLAKRYSEGQPWAEQQRLRENVAWLWGLPVDQWLAFMDRITWPMGLILDDAGQVCGVLIRDLSPAYDVTCRAADGTTETFSVHLKHCLQEDDYLQRHFGHPARLDESTRAAILRAICECVAMAHRHRIVINDFSENNILLRLHEDTVEACLIDADCMGRQGQPLRPLVTEFWGAPEGRESLTSEADVYRVGRTALYLFARRRRAMPAEVATVLPPPLREVGTRSLAHSPTLRPAIGEWEIALEGYVRALPARRVAVPAPAAPAAVAAVAPAPTPAPPPRQAPAPAPAPRPAPLAPPRQVGPQSPQPRPGGGPRPVAPAAPRAVHPTAPSARGRTLLAVGIVLAAAAGVGYLAALVGAYTEHIAATVALGVAALVIAWLCTRDGVVAHTKRPQRVAALVAPCCAIGAFVAPTLLYGQERVPPLFPGSEGPLVEVSQVALRADDGSVTVRRPVGDRRVGFRVCPGQSRTLVTRYRVARLGLLGDVEAQLVNQRGERARAVTTFVGGQSYRTVFHPTTGPTPRRFVAGDYRLTFTQRSDLGRFEPVTRTVRIRSDVDLCAP